MLSALAAGSSAGSTILGSTALRVGWLTGEERLLHGEQRQQRPHVGHPHRGLHPEQPAGDDQPDGRADEDGPAVEDVGQRAAVQAEDDQGHEPEEAGQPDVRRRPGHRVDLRRHGHHRQLGADDRDDVGDPEPSEVRDPQRPRVGEDPDTRGTRDEPTPRRGHRDDGTGWSVARAARPVGTHADGEGPAGRCPAGLAAWSSCSRVSCPRRSACRAAPAAPRRRPASRRSPRRRRRRRSRSCTTSPRRPRPRPAWPRPAA